MRAKRKLGSRMLVHGTKARPRLAVFKSNTNLYAQIIDDDAGATVVSASVSGKNAAAAQKLGGMIAEKAKKAKITTVVFDRGGMQYHGAVQAVAEAAREGGLAF